MYKVNPSSALSDAKPQTSAAHAHGLTFHAEKHGGAYLPTSYTHRFICQRLHVFELTHSDVQCDKWCTSCNRRNAKHKNASFSVRASASGESIAVGCACGRQYNLRVPELKKFKGCAPCASAKENHAPIVDTCQTDAQSTESALKSQENTFIETYKRLVEAFPLIRKLPTNKVVELYFEREVFAAPLDLQPNCLAVHLIAEQRAFVRAIFDRLNEQLKRKFAHKILSGITPVLKIEARTYAVLEYVKSLAH